MQDFHPIFVHFPVALIPISMLLGLWSLIQRRNRGLRHAYRFCLLVCIVFALVAVLTGHEAADKAQRVVPHDLLETHEELGTTTFWLVLVAGIIELLSAWPRLSAWTTPIQALSFVVVVTSVITVALAGHRGAQMVYRYKAGIGTVFTLPAPAPDSVTRAPAAAAPAEGE
jgi:uncharacterized membrane protein